MFDLTNFTPWVFFTDAGIICGLLLIGKLLRVKIRLIQKLFIPPSLLAGLLGLTFGPNGLGWLPLSSNVGTYSSILIAIVFAALPFSSPRFKVKDVARRVGYSDPFYFSRIFRSYTGKSPTEFVNEVQGEPYEN